MSEFGVQTFSDRFRLFRHAIFEVIMLAQYLAAQGIRLKKKTASEWSTACPMCGGDDRMIIFAGGGRNNGGRYWCRQCQRHGDEISWHVDIEGRGVAFLKNSDSDIFRQRKTKADTPGHFQTVPDIAGYKQTKPDPEPFTWARGIAEDAAKNVGCRAGKEFYTGRGLSMDTVRGLRFGWQDKDIFLSAKETGRSDGKWTCVPAGAVMPVYGETGELERMLVRRSDESRKNMCHRAGLPDDGKNFKWCELGNKEAPFLLGKRGQEFILCESILDAASVWQATHGCRAVAATLGASKKPDSRLVSFLREAEHVLICADADEGGETLCKMALGVRPDALVWRPAGEQTNDLNDVLRVMGDGQLALFLILGFVRFLKDEDEF